MAQPALPPAAAAPPPPPLPDLPKPPAKEMRGPTDWSNWVIPGRVIAGAYPASLDDADTERVLTLLLELGTTTFVCLQASARCRHPPPAAVQRLAQLPPPPPPSPHELIAPLGP